MATAHEVHRAMEENFFGAFQRQPSFNSSYRSLTASDLISLPSTRRHVPSSVTSPTTNIQPPPVQQYKCRPASDILQAKPIRDKNSPEAEAIDRWFENIQRYEQMLEQVAAASLDQDFKDELQHINQWFRCRSDAERTAALYTVVQNASQIQIRFLITVLQQIANGGEPYLAGQETSTNSEPYYQQQQGLNRGFTSHSVISTESEYESRKRQLYPPSSNNRRLYSTNKLSSAISEPDDLRRRNRDLFVSRPLGLSHPGPLYEKALAARAQLQAMNGGNTTSSTSSSIISSSSSSSLSNTSNLGSTGGLFASPPRLRTSCSTTDLSSSKSLFSNSDWPFPITAKTNSTIEDSWSFGSLSSHKKKINPASAPGSTTSSMVGTKKKEDTLPWAIQEEEQEYSKLSATINSSLSALEQAQARLRQDLPTTTATTITKNPITTTKWSPPPPPSPSVTQSQSIHAPASTFGQFLALPPGEDNNSDDDQSDTSSNREKPLTGLARRRKRSSAARALKDKLAAETVDFELMKDVQNWLRSLRLHKYGHAFIGLEWKQVIRMSDQDMIDAGVNTIGARRKLLKVFENVQRHCQENNID